MKILAAAAAKRVWQGGGAKPMTHFNAALDSEDGVGRASWGDFSEVTPCAVAQAASGRANNKRASFFKVAS